MQNQNAITSTALLVVTLLVSALVLVLLILLLSAIAHVPEYML